jgi:hypothetical protein
MAGSHRELECFAVNIARRAKILNCEEAHILPDSALEICAAVISGDIN